MVVYRLEYTKRQTKCTGPQPCKNSPIAKGELRFGALGDVGEFQRWFWRHWGCTTTRQLATLREQFDSVEDVDGYEDLKPEDQARVAKAFECGHVDDADIPESAKYFNEDGEQIAKPPRTPRKKANKKGDREDETAEEEEKAKGQEDEDEKPKKTKRAKKKANASSSKVKVEDELEETEKIKGEESEEDVKPNKKKVTAVKRSSKAKVKKEVVSEDDEEPIKSRKRKAKKQVVSSDDEDDDDDEYGSDEDEGPSTSKQIKRVKKSTASVPSRRSARSTNPKKSMREASTDSEHVQGEDSADGDRKPDIGTAIKAEIQEEPTLTNIKPEQDDETVVETKTKTQKKGKARKS